MLKIFNKFRKNLSGVNQDIYAIKQSLIESNQAINDIKAAVNNKDGIDLKFILSTLPSYFPLLIFVAMFIGSFEIHSFLFNIGYSGLFGDIIKDPPILIAITSAYSILICSLLIYFLLSYLISVSSIFIDEIVPDIQISNKEILWNITHLPHMIIQLYNTILIAIMYFGVKLEVQHLYLGLILCLFYSIRLYCKLGGSVQSLVFGLFSLMAFSYSFLYPYVYVDIITAFESRSTYQWIIFFSLPIISLAIIIISHKVMNPTEVKQHQNKKNDAKFIGVVCMLILSAFVTYLTLFTKFSDLSLYALRFIEKPQDSSWYLANNHGTTENPKYFDGMNGADLKRRQQDFNTEDKNCSNLQEQCKKDYFDVTKRDNALYGYMAWNLGNTKIFCPASVNFFDGKGNEGKSDKCLVIDGKHLQPVSSRLLNDES
ncbi:hypothetical protein [Moraxella marmotae]|uniref:hypothetical protein n=1 Tax=Moraxella marmotae TaxID=3344520 RepID=UPI0035F24A8B